MSVKKKVLVAYSGGVNSTVLAYDMAASYGPENVVLCTVNTQAVSWTKVHFRARYYADRIGCALCYGGDVFLSDAIKSIHPMFSETGADLDRKARREFMRRTKGLVDIDIVSDRHMFQCLYVPGLYTQVWVLLGMYAVQHDCSTLAIGMCSNASTYRHVPKFDGGDLPMDTSVQFLQSLHNMRESIWGLSAPEIVMPYAGLSKVAVVEHAKNLGVDLWNTCSCIYDPPCHACSKCFERRYAFEQARVEI